VRYLAWLAAVPRKRERTEGLDDGERLCRQAEMEAEGLLPDMPDVSAEHYIGLLMDAGPIMATGAGVTGLTWREIEAWQGRTAIELDPWECRLIRQLSIAYASELQAAENPDRPSPFQPEISDEVRDRVEAKLDLLFGGRG
jgi:hypothetical protein